MTQIKKACSFKIDWSQGSTKRAAIVLPFAVIGVILIIFGNIERGIAVVGLVQTIYSLLGITVSDTPLPDFEDEDQSHNY